MMTEMRDMPVLQAEDDGFLSQLKMRVLDDHLETLKLDGCITIDDCVSKLIEDSTGSIDQGASLPLYVPWRDDEGIIRGNTAEPVWAGTHVGIPLYGDLAQNEVESLITGNRIGASKLYEGFMAYSPAFRVALLVHHICQIVLIHPLAAEAFVLGRYGELPFDDPHFEESGIPATSLVSISQNDGLRTTWRANGSHSLVGAHAINSTIVGWTVRFRGSQPKEALMLEAWQEIRSRLDMPREVKYTSGGAKMRLHDPSPSGRRRKRVGDPAVDRVISWIEYMRVRSEFPMRGSMKDWKTAIALFDKENPDLAGRWTADSMRKAYERRRRRDL